MPESLRTDDFQVLEEGVLSRKPGRHGEARGTASGLQLVADVPPGHVFFLTGYHSSGIITFHRPVSSSARRGGPARDQLIFDVPAKRHSCFR